MSIAFGITGVFPVYVFVQNAVAVGATGGLMASCGRLDLFFGLITPHGLLELTAVFVALAAGLRLFWAWIDPGARSRLDALAQEGRAMVGIAVGLVVVLFVSGVVEAYVTPSPLPTWARIAIGAAGLGGRSSAYVVVLGRSGRAGRARPVTYAAELPRRPRPRRRLSARRGRRQAAARPRQSRPAALSAR